MEKTSSAAPAATRNLTVWILGLGALALLPALLPLPALVTALAVGAAAVWLLSQGPAEAVIDNTTAAEPDEDLDLPPQGTTRSGAASRKFSMAIETRTPRSFSQKPGAASQLTGLTPRNAATAASLAGGTTTERAPANIGDGRTAAISFVDSTANDAAKAPAQPATAVNKSNDSIQPPAAGPTQAADTAAQPVALTGSAAILAKLRSQRQAPTAKTQDAAALPKVTVLYASQTGTGQEIARTLQAECSAKGMPAQVMSFNELGLDNLTAAKTPLVVFIASSTGDGDPPDNAATAYVAMKKQWPKDKLAGIRYTVLGLGDSNYTRFMHVSRTLKSRFQELGAQCFYKCAEADEVDGIEATVDPWCDNLYKPLQKMLQEIQQPQAADGVTAASAASKQSSPPDAAGRALGAEPSSCLGAEPSVMGAELLASVTGGTDSANAAVADVPRVQMELSEASGGGELSGQASLFGEDSSVSQPAALSAQQSATSSRTPSASKASRATAPQVQLVNGLAPAGVDLAGVPALAPCRVAINQQVSAAVAEAARQHESDTPSAEQLKHRDPEGHYGPEQPFWARISDARRMTAEKSDRIVLHMELDVSNSGIKYGPGDSLGVLPQNPAQLVSALLQRLGLDGDAVFEVQPVSGDGASANQHLLSHIPWPCTLRHAFTHCTDVTSVPRKSLLRMLAEHCSNVHEQRTLLFFTSRAGRDAYAEEISVGQPSLLDLLQRFPSCNPPVDALLDALQPLAPRLYSLTNAPVAERVNSVAIPGACGPNRLQFAFSVVRFDTKYGSKSGVASNWLAGLSQPWVSGTVKAGVKNAPDVLVPIYIKRSAFFTPPASLATPMIMIGPGTGVAPYRGFLQQRMADMLASGETRPGTAVLYFGSRRQDEDYLYEKDWQQFISAGVLQKLRLAFSRAQDTKVYVQHLMRADAAELAQYIIAGAYVFVCGDGAAMAKDVNAALCDVLKGGMGMDEAAAHEEVAEMIKAGRYVRDIWS